MEVEPTTKPSQTTNQPKIEEPCNGDGSDLGRGIAKDELLTKWWERAMEGRMRGAIEAKRG